MAKQEKHLLRLTTCSCHGNIRRVFMAHDGYTQNRLMEKGYSIGDSINAVLTKARNPKFNRLVHAFGKIVSENIEMFEGMDSHKVLKRVQIEGRIECDEVGIYIEGHGMLIQFIPRSLSFSSMGEEIFSEVFKLMCRHIASTYWKDQSPEQIENMAELMAGE